MLFSSLLLVFLLGTFAAAAPVDIPPELQLNPLGVPLHEASALLGLTYIRSMDHEEYQITNLPSFQKKQHKDDIISFEGPLDTLKLHLTDIQFSSGHNSELHFKKTPISLLTIDKDPEVFGYWKLPEDSGRVTDRIKIWPHDGAFYAEIDKRLPNVLNHGRS